MARAWLVASFPSSQRRRGDSSLARGEVGDQDAGVHVRAVRATQLSSEKRGLSTDAGFGRRLGPQTFSRRWSVGQLCSPPVERDDPHREFGRASIERLSELGDSYEIVA